MHLPLGLAFSSPLKVWVQELSCPLDLQKNLNYQNPQIMMSKGRIGISGKKKIALFLSLSTNKVSFSVLFCGFQSAVSRNPLFLSLKGSHETTLITFWFHY